MSYSNLRAARHFSLVGALGRRVVHGKEAVHCGRFHATNADMLIVGSSSQELRVGQFFYFSQLTACAQFVLQFGAVAYIGGGSYAKAAGSPMRRSERMVISGFRL